MKTRVAVVGAGPVGLFQALSLVRAGLETTVFERWSLPHRGSRSIGIHPPSLELLDELGLASPFVRAGVRVRQGHAFGAAGRLGSIDFARSGGSFPFVLALPQYRTEKLLSDALEASTPGVLHRGAEVQDIWPQQNSVRLETSAGPVDAEWVVACDGRHSRIRKLLNIGFDAHDYDGTYAMEDHLDQTPFGSDAAVFLSQDGLVESFPLPEGQRRWVARIDDRAFQPAVAERTGFQLHGDTSQTSYFHAERGMAKRMFHGRIVLAGDAAHVVSPIGGQGMNLGWLGAAKTTRALKRALGGDTHALLRDAHVRARTARAAMRRAEINMWLGRPTKHDRLRNLLVKTLLNPPWERALSRAFTMRGLQWGV